MFTMSLRMADAATPHHAGTQTTDESPRAPRVSIVLTSVEGADIDAALAIVRRQAYEPAPSIVVVGALADPPADVTVHSTLESAIADAGSEIDYLWLLHSDARPRPDALAKLVTETERNEASLAGSKLLVAGTKDFLESVGSATDVFGEPYSGLEEGEIDLQQYDVVREVAFVRSASILVRRDLAQGLKGLDVLLPPVAAGLDFSQRARLAGGRVIIVPSSEVYHQGRCNEVGTGWREQAGRLRAMLTAYSPLTLLWVLPYELLVSIVDTLGSLLLGRWRPAARHFRSWLWNIYHLPSTFGLRRRFKPVRSTGDEELFRFQARGSVRLRELGSELTARVLLVFDEDQALVRRSRRISSSPGLWGAVLAVLVVMVSVRGLVFAGVPDAGFSFPFEAPTTALERWFNGWNEAGLGAPSSVHPAVGLAGAISWVFFGLESATRTILTIAFGLFGVLGVGRLAGRLGVRGPGRYLAGIVAIGGPGLALLAEGGSWLGLGAAALLPWSVRASVAPPGGDTSNWTRFGWALATGAVVAAFSPLLAVAPILVVALLKLLGESRPRFLLAFAALIAGAAASAAFLAGDPGWLLDADRRLGLDVSIFWPVLLGVAAVPVAFLENPARNLGLAGSLTALAGLLATRWPMAGPGVEEAGLVLASFGAALLVAAGLDSFSANPRRLMAIVPALAILVFSMPGLVNGRLGLPEGQINERLGFASTLAGAGGPGRILVASIDRSDIPGEARPGPGFWYRLIDGEEMTFDEVWLGESRPGEERLLQALERISSGSDLRPGQSLEPFAVDWIVLLGPSFRLDEVFVAQLDLVPTPLDPAARVFENSMSRPIARSGDAPWSKSGLGFTGLSSPGRVDIATNYDDGWRPDAQPDGWAMTSSADRGQVTYRGTDLHRGLVLAAIATLVLGCGLIVVGRVRR